MSETKLAVQNQEIEIGVITQDMARALMKMYSLYRKRELGDEEADHETRHTASLEWLQKWSMEADPEKVSWWQLGRLAERDPETAQDAWSRIKEAAGDELQSGHRGAKAIEGYYAKPVDRAQYLAIRASFISEWHPVNGIESALVDVLAQSLSGWLYWLERHAMQTSLESREEIIKDDGRYYWRPSRISGAAALDQAVSMAERFNRIFIRTLRALRDLRRYAPNVTIQSAGQVNIAQQQVNAAKVDG